MIIPPPTIPTPRKIIMQVVVLPLPHPKKKKEKKTLTRPRPRKLAENIAHKSVQILNPEPRHINSPCFFFVL